MAVGEKDTQKIHLEKPFRGSVTIQTNVTRLIDYLTPVPLVPFLPRRMQVFFFRAHKNLALAGDGVMIVMCIDAESSFLHLAINLLF